MIRLIIWLCFFSSGILCSQPQQVAQTYIITGADQPEAYLPLLKGKKIALLVNQTSVAGNTHLVDTLIAINNREVLGITIDKIFTPEHGFRGKSDAGEQVGSGSDANTGLPLISLYGKNKKPTSEQLKGLDWVIFDIQDTGVRCYTYISTMHFVMEACAENSVKFMVLDRPNPNGMYVDGPVLDIAQQSFVGMHPVPIVHGLTMGELAQMINGEGWLNTDKPCDLKVIPMKYYDHSKTYSLPVKPSPNLPNDLSVALYPSLCLFEGTDISVGRGTYAPFQQIGHPDFADNSTHWFTPVSIDGMSKYPKHQGKTCYGADFSQWSIVHQFSLKYLIEYYHRFEAKEKYFNSFFKKLAGTVRLEQQIKAGLTEEAIRASWQQDLNAYKPMRKRYLLYRDFE